eukprot:scaffold268306_cov15-Prasinocladus_malaysianus.AAC.1
MKICATKFCSASRQHRPYDSPNPAAPLLGLCWPESLGTSLPALACYITFKKALACAISPLS